MEAEGEFKNYLIKRNILARSASGDDVLDFMV
jgi:hypothetical protein